MGVTASARKKVFAVAAAVAMTMGVSVLSAMPSASAQTGRAYVAMGDSFPANPDIPLQMQGLITGDCVKRSDSYPDRVGQQAFGGNYVNLACNGTTLTGGAGPSIIANMNAAHARGEIGAGTQLVTITAGGAEGWNPAVPNGRDFGVIDGANYVTPQSWTQRMGPVIDRVHELAPNARVMVVGYPQVGNGQGAVCVLNVSGGVNSSVGDGNLPVAVPTSAEHYMNKINSMAASHEHLGYEYVDTFRPGTGSCAHPSNQWVRGIIDAPGAGDGFRMPVHPTALGDREVANIVTARL